MDFYLAEPAIHNQELLHLTQKAMTDHTMDLAGLYNAAPACSPDGHGGLWHCPANESSACERQQVSLADAVRSEKWQSEPMFLTLNAELATVDSAPRFDVAPKDVKRLSQGRSQKDSKAVPPELKQIQQIDVPAPEPLPDLRKPATEARDEAAAQPISASAPALVRAAQSGNQAEVLRLLAANADPCSTDDLGFSCLHGAAKKGHVCVTELLLSRRADANAHAGEACQRVVPLHYACKYGHADVARVLLANGADAAAEDREGRSALQYAAACNSGRRGRKYPVEVIERVFDEHSQN